MKKTSIAILISALLLSACESRFNPLNWFGNSDSTPTTQATTAEAIAPADPRGLVAQVVDLQIERTQGGAIIRAVGLPPTQGYYEAELLSTNDGLPKSGVLTFEFRVQEPAGLQAVSTQRSREVIVAQFLSDKKLRGVRQIRVVGAQNIRSSRR